MEVRRCTAENWVEGTAFEERKKVEADGGWRMENERCRVDHSRKLMERRRGGREKERRRKKEGRTEEGTKEGRKGGKRKKRRKKGRKQGGKEERKEERKEGRRDTWPPKRRHYVFKTCSGPFKAMFPCQGFDMVTQVTDVIVTMYLSGWVTL
jgi:hypothetical protein